MTLLMNNYTSSIFLCISSNILLFVCVLNFIYIYLYGNQITTIKK